eukprot:INCI6072.1.p1 GENE.INCI6072.1~~INCI6072.1.p1  ORF type:complete len:319 (-),score=50.98 INCI6072.1:720-1676(-)
MSLDLGGLTASAQARVSKIKKPIQPDPKVDVLESVTIVVAVVCLSLAAEYLVTSFFSLLGFGAQDDDQPWTLAASHEQFVLMNATMHSLNMTASVLQQNVSDLLREKEALQQAVAHLATFNRDIFGKRRRRVTIVCNAAPARMDELHSTFNRDSHWLYYLFIRQDCKVIHRDAFSNEGSEPDWGLFPKKVSDQDDCQNDTEVVLPSKPRRDRRGAAASNDVVPTYEVGENALPQPGWNCSGYFEQVFAAGGFAGSVVLVPGQSSALHAATLEKMPLEGPGFAYLCLDYTAQQDRCAVWAGSVVARVVYTCDMPPETAV